MKFRDIIIEAQPIGKLAKEFKDKIKKAKKGECGAIMKDIEAAFKARKLSASEFDEVSAAAGRKMDMLGESLNEEVQGINSTNVGALIVDTMAMIARAHVWHLLIKSGQKHAALNEFYTELQDEVDELAERFIAQGGTLPQRDFSLVTTVEPNYILDRVQTFRNAVSYCASQCQSPEMSSILDGVVDLQECIDSFVYKFKLD